MIRRFLLVLVCLVAVSPIICFADGIEIILPPGMTTANDVTGGMRALAGVAADSWLKLVDNKRYSETWNRAASSLKLSMTKIRWVKKVARLRWPVGALRSRFLHSQEYRTKLPGAETGKYVLLRYQSSFENKVEAEETVTVTLDKDGKWRVLDYDIKDRLMPR